jgi:TRAP-type transport system periplasmic protein
MKKLISLGLLLLSLSPLSQAATTLKIATIAPDGTNWMKSMRGAADEIKKETDGRVKLKFFPGGVQGSDKSVLRKMQIRQLQGGAVSAGALSNITNISQLYSLPFTFRNEAEVSAVRSEFDPIINKALEDKGYILLGMANGGFAYIMSNKSITALSDFQGQKVWVPEGDVVSQTTFDKAGISPVSLPISDVYTSLQTGLIDTAGVNLSASIALQWHSKLSYTTDFPLLFLMGMLVVDKPSFDKIDAADQVIVRNVMKSTFLAMDEQNIKDEEGAREALIKGGMKFVPLSDTEKAAWHTLAETTLTELANKGVYPVELYQKLQQRLTTMRAGAQ